MQITLLLHSSSPSYDSMESASGVLDQNLTEASTDIFGWLSVLWERGFLHDNPHGTSILLLYLLIRCWEVGLIIHFATFSFSIFTARNGMFAMQYGV